MKMPPFANGYTGENFDQWAAENDQPVSPYGTAELVWLDLETTGLDPVADPILETGMILTDRLGRVIHGGVARWLVFDYQDRHYNMKIHNLPTYVREMHEKSGLLADLSAAMCRPEVMAISRSRIQKSMVEWISHFAYPGGIPENIKDRHPVSGSSVHFDRAHIHFQMSDLNNCFHYRNGVDVSGFRYAMKMLNVDAYDSVPQPRGMHRPIPDLLDSIQLYRHMLGNFLAVDITEELTYA